MFLNKKTLITSILGFMMLAPSATFAANIVEVAQGNDDFSTLVDLVVAQDLAGALADEDAELTVFAPTNDAFEKVPSFVMEVLAEKPELLTQVLLYHVVPGEFKAADVLQNSALNTLQGSHLGVSLKDGAPFINKSQIVATDIMADNGVVHVIDQVVIPKAVLIEVIKTILSDLSAYL